MKQILAVTRKEVNSYFGSPMALIFLGAFLAVTLFAFFWVETFFARGIADVRPLFRWMPLLLIFLVAALTMRQWSEEQRSGTQEMLLTLPVLLYSAQPFFAAAWRDLRHRQAGMEGKIVVGDQAASAPAGAPSRDGYKSSIAFRPCSPRKISIRLSWSNPRRSIRAMNMAMLATNSANTIQPLISGTRPEALRSTHPSMISA